MKLARRYFLRVLARAGAFLALGSTSRAAGLGSGTEGSGDRTLVAYLDVLIPEDELGPGALELGVGRRIIARARESRKYGTFLDQGCRWLDDQAKKRGAESFAELSEDDRNGVVALAAEAEPNSPPRRFFRATRHTAFYLYYAEPRAWAAIGYDGPPQPEGFTDHAAAPRAIE
jgi:hypothetical protein